MRKLSLIVLVFAVFSVSSFSQFKFETYPSGLIYSNEVLIKLRDKNEAVHQKFLSRNYDKLFYSFPQSSAKHFRVKGPIVKDVLHDLSKNISYDELTNKYKKEINIDDVYLYLHEEKRDVIAFSCIGFLNLCYSEVSISKSEFLLNTATKNSWIYNKEEFENSKSPFFPTISFFYIIDGFSQKIIPEYLANNITYADCMIDKPLFNYEEKDLIKYSKKEKSKEVDTLLDYVTSALPFFVDTHWMYNSETYELDSAKFKAYRDALSKFEKELKVAKDKLYNNDQIFTSYLNNAKRAIELNPSSCDEFELILTEVNDKELALDLKRKRIPIARYGGISIDQYWDHIFEIAKLAAETFKLEIFLRSHLTLMNRYEEFGDGSFNRVKYPTYIKEVEGLNLNFNALFQGITAKTNNPNFNHFNVSTIGLGRALAELKNGDHIANDILKIASDKNLDHYNRIIFAYLYLNYKCTIENKNSDEINKDEIATALKDLPSYMVKF